MISVASLLAVGGLLLLGLYVVAQGVSPLRPRRALTGLALLAAPGLILWAHFGSPVVTPRAAVIVFSDEAATEDLRALAEAPGAGDRVAWLRVCREPVPAGERAAWMTAEDALPTAGESPEEYRRRLVGGAAGVTLEGRGWLERLIEADRAVRADSPSLADEGYQHTLIVLHDRGPTWGGLGSAGLGPGDASARLQGPATEVYLMPARAEDLPGWLELDLEREVIPPVGVDNLGVQRVRVSLRGADNLRATRPDYELRLWLDGGPDDPGQPHHELTASFPDPGPDSALLREVVLSNLLPAGGQPAKAAVRAGFHRVYARLTVRPSRAGAAPLVYSASRHFLVDPRGILLLHPGGLGSLAGPTWTPPPADPGELLKQFLCEKNRQGQRARAELSADNVVSLPFATEPDVLRAALSACRVVVLVEPTHEELLRLDRELPLGQRLRDGLTVLVIGPPVRAEPWPVWLPCAALPAKGTKGPQEPAEILRDRRVYFCPENLRLLKFPARDRLTQELSETDVTGLRAQRDVMAAVCKELGADGSRVRVEGEAGLEPRLTATEPSQPWRGHFQRDGREIEVTLYPPAAPLLRQVSGEAPRAEWETLAGFLPARLRPLEEAHACLATKIVPLSGPRLHAGASVVLFLDDLPQPATLPEDGRKAICSAFDPGTAWPSAPMDRECVARLARLGVTVYAVRLQLDPVYRKVLGDLSDLPPLRDGRTAEDYLDGVRKNPELAPFLKEIPLELTPESVEKVGKELVRWIKAQPGDLVRQRTGRVVDERGAAGRSAPERHRALQVPRESEFNRPHAVIEDPRFPEGHPGRLAAAVQSFQVEEGTVVVYGYSPFARDVWQSDAGAAGWPGARLSTQPHADGWGVQRLLDAAELTTPRRAAPKRHPVVRGVRVADDEATLWIDCWATLAPDHESGWPEPSLHRADGAGRLQKVPAEVTLQGVDPLAGGVTFQVRYLGREPLRDWFAIQFDERETELAARPSVYLDLRPASPGGRTARETLGQLAGLTGGTVLTHETAAAALVFRRSASWWAGILLTGVVLLLLSPPLRPWAVLRRRRRTPPPGGGARHSASFDVRGVLVEWGFNPGAPQAARRAGDPAGQKPYEPGDSLAAARAATLLPFTAGGRVLPPRRPVVRQRVVGRAMEAVLLLDCTPSLFVPADVPSKADYVVLLARLLAGAVWTTAGQVSIASVQQPRETRGPCGAGHDSEDFAGQVRDLLSRGARRPFGRLLLPEPADAGQIVFFLTDFLAPREEELPLLLDHCAREEISFRAVQVRGAPDPGPCGPGFSALTNRLLDRAEWTAGDLALAEDRHSAEMRALVEARGGRFAAVTADLSAGDLFERLIQRGIVT